MTAKKIEDLFLADELAVVAGCGELAKAIRSAETHEEVDGLRAHEIHRLRFGPLYPGAGRATDLAIREFLVLADSEAHDLDAAWWSEPPA